MSAETADLVIPYSLERGEHAWEATARVPGRPFSRVYGVAATPGNAFAEMATRAADLLDAAEVPVFVRVGAVAC